jgi:ribose transport system ATP-binding protein
MSLQVEFRGITKSFGPVQVLHGVDFSLPTGQVLGLLGENGAGKSTLMKILAGFEQATGGSLVINGRVITFANSREAEVQGIVLIHQEFSLADDLSIAQNLFLGHEKRRGWGGLLLDDDAMRAEAQLAIAQVGLQSDVDTRVKDLIVAEKQLIEIARALMRKARVLIMDEPTATLTPTETERLFGLMEELKRDGVTLIYISHKLDEVERVTDHIVVMRDGVCVAQQPTAELTRQQMANLMVGRELADLYPPKSPPPTAVTSALSVKGMSVPGWAQDVSFEVRPGEILGFAGLVGAGRTELFEGLMGLRPRSTGTVALQGQLHTIRNPRDAVRLGLTYLSEDRKGKGLHVNFGLSENLTLMALERYATPLLQPKREHETLVKAVDEFGIRTGSLHIKASSLSGGNQQKVALAKVLHPNPKVVVLDEPTRGVDVGAKRDIYLLIQKLASQGLAVIIISSELMELIGVCHRVAVMRGGRLQTILESQQLTEEELIAHATGTH